MTRVVYDGLAAGFHTWVWEEDRDVVEGDGDAARYRRTGQPDVFPNQVVEVVDLYDPRSERAYVVRDAIARGIARVVEPVSPAEG